MARHTTAVDHPDQIDALCVNTIRTLSMDAVQQANSGHPGTPMAMAPVVYCLWQRHLRFDPEAPIWPNRDRFVLSIGHASMLLYSMLHLCRVRAVNPRYEALGKLAVTLEDIQRFRQFESKSPGHPEYRWTSGVETTTGPLGQGVATSVGMAMAGKWMADYFNRPEFTMFDYDTYALCGDGCMMEGVSSEAASLAGHLKLSNLCWIYDNNKISIEGHTDWAFSDDVATRFIGYGWNVTRVGDANDLEMLDRAFDTFKNVQDRPTLIIVDSHIAYGSPNKQDTSAAHGAPLGEDEVRLTKKAYGWPEEAKFLVPEEVTESFRRQISQRGQSLRTAWMERFEEYRKAYPTPADHLYRMQHRELPEELPLALPSFPADPKGVSGRDASGQVMNAHLDSTNRGPGIQDNGSGSAAILETALGMARVKPRNKVRFAWWGAEEAGLIGSTYYVDNLSEEEREQITLYLNFDMIGSPNHVFFIYDGDDSDGVGAGPGPAGSEQIEQLFELYYTARGEAFKGTDFSGRSDYGPFIAVGIPSGGIFTGAEDIKTAEEATAWGGTAGEQYDPCYHLACDTFDNINLEALDINADAVAFAVPQYAMNTISLNGRKGKGNFKPNDAEYLGPSALR